MLSLQLSKTCCTLEEVTRNYITKSKDSTHLGLSASALRASSLCRGGSRIPRRRWRRPSGGGDANIRLCPFSEIQWLGFGSDAPMFSKAFENCYGGFKNLTLTHTERQQVAASIEIHCDAPKSVLDPFPNITLYTIDPMGSNLILTLTLDAQCVYSLKDKLAEKLPLFRESHFHILLIT